MRKVSQFLLALLIAVGLLAAPSVGASPAFRDTVLYSGVVAGTQPGSSLDCNYQRALCTINRHVVPMSSVIAPGRATADWVEWSSGRFTPVVANVWAMSDLGYQIYEARNNDALWSRDLSQAGTWTATSVTAVKDAVGVDGVTNSASTITATADNGTILQSITLGSAARELQVQVMRKTGTGVLNATLNNGTAWTALSASNCWRAGTRTASAPSASYWVSCSITATLANPVVGFRLTTNGDAFYIDMVNLQNGAFWTSPCSSTTAQCVRAATVPTLIGPAQTAALNARAAFFRTFRVAGGLSPRLLYYSSSGSIFYNFTNDTNNGLTAGSNAVATFGSGTNAGLSNSAYGFATGNITAIVNGGYLATGGTAIALSGTVYLGNVVAGNRALNGFLQRFVLGPNFGMFNSLAVAGLVVPFNYAANDNAPAYHYEFPANDNEETITARAS